MIDTLDVGSVRLKGGYFLVNGPDPAPFPGHERTFDKDYVHCFTYAHSDRGNEQNIKHAVLDLIRKARRKLFVTSFRIGDADLIEALCAAARRLRGGVYIVTELDFESLRRGLAETEADADEAVQAQQKDFHALTQAGIYVRGYRDCHAKFVVVDDRRALVSSANLETNAFVRTGESGVVLTAPAEVDRLARFFTRLWHGCEWEMAPGRSYLVSERTGQPCPCRVPLPAVATPPEGTEGVGVIWTHEDEQSIRETLHDVIARARQDLVLSTFSLAGLTQHPDILLAPLEKAVRRNHPRIRLLVRSRNHIEGTRQDALALAELGVEIHADARNHAKGVIADRRYGALFSANFDAHHGLNQGVEVGVRLDGQPALADALQYFEHAIAQANIGFVVAPTQAELATSLAVGWRQNWPLSRTVPLTCSVGDWAALSQAVGTAPVLFTTRDGIHLTLYAGTTRWSLTARADEPAVLERESAGGEKSSATDRLAGWLRETRPRRDSDSGTDKRGFCPAVFVRREEVIS